MRTTGFRRAVVVVVSLSGGVATACWGGSNAPATPTNGPGGGGTQPAATASTAVPASPTARPTVTVGRMLEGPASIEVRRVTKVLGPRPESAFPAWDRRQTVVYDTTTGTAIDLGEGTGASFSFDSRWAGWIANPTPQGVLNDLVGEATIQNLETGERRTFGRGLAIVFVDEARVKVFPPERGLWRLYDFATGRLSADQTTIGALGYRPTPEGNQLWVTPVKGSEGPRGGYGRSTFDLRDPSGALILEFEAVAAIPSGPNELIVATAASGGFTNIYILHTDTGEAEIVTGTRYGNGPNWPFSATADAILWTDAFCSSSPGRMQLIDRRTSTLIEIDDGITPSLDGGGTYGRLTPRGLIALGFEVSALVDPATMTYVAVLPPFTGNGPVTPSWSRDYRYASYYDSGGRGGLC